MNIKFNCTLSTIIHTVNPTDISVFQIYLHVSVLCAVLCTYCFYLLMSAGPNAHFTLLFTAYNWAHNKIELILSYLSKTTAGHQGAPFIPRHLHWRSLPEDRWWFLWEPQEELRYSRWWSGTATSCGASWTLCGSSSGPPHSVKPWSWSPPSPLHLYSARGQNISQRDGSWWRRGRRPTVWGKKTWQRSRFSETFTAKITNFSPMSSAMRSWSTGQSSCGSVAMVTALPYLHGIAESVGEVELSVLEALDCEETKDEAFSAPPQRKELTAPLLPSVMKDLSRSPFTSILMLSLMSYGL